VARPTVARPAGAPGTDAVPAGTLDLPGGGALALVDGTALPLPDGTAVPRALPESGRSDPLV
jgi:hypothetical protein